MRSRTTGMPGVRHGRMLRCCDCEGISCGRSFSFPCRAVAEHGGPNESPRRHHHLLVLAYLLVFHRHQCARCLVLWTPLWVLNWHRARVSRSWDRSSRVCKTCPGFAISFALIVSVAEASRTKCGFASGSAEAGVRRESGCAAARRSSTRVSTWRCYCGPSRTVSKGSL